MQLELPTKGHEISYRVCMVEGLGVIKTGVTFFARRPINSCIKV
jgi:hypothetical protein